MHRGAQAGLALAVFSWLTLAGSGAQAQDGATSVDLLHAVATDVAVSSVYRSQRAQVDRLFDGDLETAWNSRTGDLVGAWIEVRLPADAVVTGIAMTPGFTHTTEARDLFTSNHRIARVRVLRDGTEVGSYPLDTSAPALVTIPVSGPGGVYRIEVAEVLVGSRTDWRETCISELRILGRAPSMTPGARLPRSGVGALPAVSAPTPADRTAVDRAQRRDVGWLVTSWTALQRDIDELASNTGEPDPDTYLQQDFERQRDAMLTRIAALVAPVDAVRADALRIEAARTIDWRNARARTTAFSSAVDVMFAALDAVAAFLDTDEARCRSARTQAGIRLRRIASAAHSAEYFDEIDAFDSDHTGSPPAHTPAASRALERDDGALDAAIREWSGNSRGVATRLARRDAPADPAAAAEWPALLTQLSLAQTACGWATP